MAYLFDVFEYVAKRAFESRFVNRVVSCRQVTDDCRPKGRISHKIQRIRKKNEPSGRLLYIALSFVDSSSKKSLAKSAILGSGSSKHFAISPSWPLTLIIPFRIRCVRTMSVFFLTTMSLSERPLYSSLLFSSTILLKDTATSPRAMTMLLRMLGSLEVSRILNNSR